MGPPSGVTLHLNVAMCKKRSKYRSYAHIMVWLSRVGLLFLGQNFENEMV